MPTPNKSRAQVDSIDLASTNGEAASEEKNCKRQGRLTVKGTDWRPRIRELGLALVTKQFRQLKESAIARYELLRNGRQDFN